MIQSLFQTANSMQTIEFVPATNITPIRLLLVEDQTIIREGLRLLLESKSAGIVVSEAVRSHEAVSVALHEQPDIILLNFNLSSGNELALIPDLLAAAPAAGVLILTGESDPVMPLDAVSLGVKGVIRKSGTAEVLFEAIRKVYDGEVWFDGVLMARLLSDMRQMRTARQTEAGAQIFPSTVEPLCETNHHESGQATEQFALESAKIATLTDREREIVVLLCEGLKNKQIADRLFISAVTVRHHLSSVFSKLEVADRFELAMFAFRHRLAKLPL